MILMEQPKEVAQSVIKFIQSNKSINLLGVLIYYHLILMLSNLIVEFKFKKHNLGI